MKKIVILFSVFILTIMSFIMSQNALATTGDNVISDTVSSGITPDSPFYFLDRLGETLQEFFTFNKESKIKLQIEFASERVAEVNFLVSQDGKIDTKAINKAKVLLLGNVAKAAEIIKEEKIAGKEIAQLAKETDDAFDKQEHLLDQTFLKARKELLQNRLKAKEQLLRKANEAGNSEQIVELQADINELKNIDDILKTEKKKIKKELRAEKKHIEEEMDKDDQKQDDQEQINEDKQDHEEDQKFENEQDDENEISEKSEKEEQNEIEESDDDKKIEENKRENTKENNHKLENKEDKEDKEDEE